MDNKIIICGVGRSGTTYFWQHLNRVAGPVINEPFAAWCPDLELRNEVLALYQANKLPPRFADWLGETSTSTINTVVPKLLKMLAAHYPDVRGFKTIDKPFFNLYRQIWPNCHIIYVTRSLSGRLMAMNRWYEAWLRMPLVPLPTPTHIQFVIDDFCRQHAVPPSHRDLWCTAIFYTLVDQYWQKLLPPDAITVDYGAAVSEWDITWERILNHCGIEHSPEKLDQFMPKSPPRDGRNASAPFSLVDVCTAAEAAHAYSAQSKWEPMTTP